MPNQQVAQNRSLSEAEENPPMTKELSFWEFPDTLQPKRFWISTATGTGIYSGFSIGLWNSWYKNQDISAFHLFNDMGEWNQYDKAGHFMTAYIEAYYGYRLARWTGMDHKSSVWTGAGIGTGLQLTIEIMDGFSEKWGFSWGDIAFNELGVALFTIQALTWEEQRILMKYSTNNFNYPDDFALSGNERYYIPDRAAELYGTLTLETALKDYNEQKTWASVNVWSFLPERENSRFPKWLNVAVGYGVGNIYGGFDNSWTDENGVVFNIDNEYPRYRQVLLSLDIDLTKVKTKSKFWNAILTGFNWVKIPAPTLEWNTLGQVKFHPIYW